MESLLPLPLKQPIELDRSIHFSRWAITSSKEGCTIACNQACFFFLFDKSGKYKTLLRRNGTGRVGSFVCQPPEVLHSTERDSEVDHTVALSMRANGKCPLSC